MTSFSTRDRLSGFEVANEGFVQSIRMVSGSGAAVGTSGTATKTSVASLATSAVLIAANTSRVGVSIRNTDANVLTIDPSGGTAVAGEGVDLATGAYWEAPYGYTGAISGIWAVNGTGAAIVHEYT